MNASRVFHVDSKKIISIVLWLNLFFFASLTHAEDVSINITIQDHRFYPSVSKIPAGVAFNIVFINADKTPEDLVSESMFFEQAVAGGSRQAVQVAPLKGGSYNFFGKLSRDTAQGTIIVE